MPKHLIDFKGKRESPIEHVTIMTKMTQTNFVKSLKKGDKVLVQYKGLRRATVTEINSRAWLMFDSGDGQGVALHPVLKTTLKPVSSSGIEIVSAKAMAQIEAARQSQKAMSRRSEATSREIEEGLNTGFKKVSEPKKLSASEVLELVRAGFTRDEIMAMK